MTFRRFRSSLTTLMIAASLLLPVLITAPVAAQISEENKNAACAGVGAVGGDCSEETANNSVDNIVATVINILSWIVGVAAVIMIIIGGFRYVTSNGDSNAISGAKNTILYAIIGIVVAAFAQIIVRFVLSRTV